MASMDGGCGHGGDGGSCHHHSGGDGGPYYHGGSSSGGEQPLSKGTKNLIIGALVVAAVVFVYDHWQKMQRDKSKAPVSLER
jgi:hypothetical protein